MTDLTPDDLAAIRARANAATKGDDPVCYAGTAVADEEAK